MNLALAVEKLLRFFRREDESSAVQAGFLEGLTTYGMKSEVFRNYAIVSESVQYLVDARRDGPNTSFGRQFFRTLRLESSDSRDKVFGLLGISSFDDHEQKITPDYNKSVLQVSTQATVAVLKANFVSFVLYQPWSLASTGPSWVINLGCLSSPQIADFLIALYERDLSEVLKRADRVAPIFHFWDDNSRLLTGGLSMGRIVASESLNGLRHWRFLENISAESRSLGLDLSADKAFFDLFRPYFPPEQNMKS
ncbi:hypothetical protein IQ06DRAFT_14719 [Phaeosphaeriaceae sp. SRC1lsM3a]|nr:hypothetical protein IQ06DRAFT_14719 [Stagonospora sp. SRC1lsM3a]